MLSVFKKGKIGESYNIGSGENLRNIDIAKKLLIIAKNKFSKVGENAKIKFVKDRPGHDFRYALNSNKILKKLNWKTKINLNQGLHETILWYLKNKKFLKKILKKDYEKRLGLKI